MTAHHLHLLRSVPDAQSLLASPKIPTSSSSQTHSLNPMSGFLSRSSVRKFPPPALTNRRPIQLPPAPPPTRSLHAHRQHSPLTYRRSIRSLQHSRRPRSHLVQRLHSSRPCASGAMRKLIPTPHPSASPSSLCQISLSLSFSTRLVQVLPEEINSEAERDGIRI